MQATPIEGREWAESPFFSPDGQWVGFWQAAPDTLQSGELKKVALAGSPIVTICRKALPAGISWGPNSRIISANHGGGGLWQVADAGGAPEALTTPDSARGELSHRLPHALPDGRAVLFTVQRSPGGSGRRAGGCSVTQFTSEQKLLVDGRHGHTIRMCAARIWCTPASGDAPRAGATRRGSRSRANRSDKW